MTATRYEYSEICSHLRLDIQELYEIYTNLSYGTRFKINSYEKMIGKSAKLYNLAFHYYYYDDACSTRFFLLTNDERRKLYRRMKTLMELEGVNVPEPPIITMQVLQDLSDLPELPDLRDLPELQNLPKLQNLQDLHDLEDSQDLQD
jgi:hypothetical protein